MCHNIVAVLVNVWVYKLVTGVPCASDPEEKGIEDITEHKTEALISEWAEYLKGKHTFLLKFLLSYYFMCTVVLPTLLCVHHLYTWSCQ